MTKFKGLSDVFKAIPEGLENALELSVQESVAQLDTDLKDGSPVDSGRFRASWFQAQARGGDPSTDRVAPEVEKGQKVPAPPNLEAASLDGLANHIVVNNLPYAERLCEAGWSKKVSEDWFKRIAQKWDTGKYLDEALKNNIDL
jgi:hypothetical protein